jgi:hypothetical protein
VTRFAVGIGSSCFSAGTDDNMTNDNVVRRVMADNSLPITQEGCNFMLGNKFAVEVVQEDSGQSVSRVPPTHSQDVASGAMYEQGYYL